MWNRGSEAPGELTIQNPDGFSGTLKRARHGPEIAASIDIPLHVVVVTRRRKTLEAMLGWGLSLAVLRVRLGVDGGADLGRPFCTVLLNSALDLA